jgi:uncharacterized HAD superfamily protein
MAKIGIDIDDTITDSSSLVKEYVEKYDEYYSDCHILKNRMQDIMRGFFNHEAIVKFYLDHGREISRNVEVRPDAKEVIEKLKSEGHEIIIITARTNKYYKNAKRFCKNYLDKHNIPYDKLLTGQVYKVNACVEEGIDIMVDDGVDTCDDLNRNGIKALLYSTEVNKDMKTISPRVYSWKETYQKINNYLKNK